MTGFGILITIFIILALAFYKFSFHLVSRDIKEINMYFLIGFLMIWWSIWLMTDLQCNLSKSFYLAFVGLGIYLFKLIKDNSKKDDISIKVKQESYWNIKPSSIYDYYKFRTIEKSDRVETAVNKLSKHFYRQYANDIKFMTGNIFKEMEEIKLTKIQTTKELSNSLLYDKIFKKIKYFMKSLEQVVDWEEILKENDFYAEYFLIDIWCRFTKPFNIGTANLSVLATNNTEYELVGAIDNADLNSVKRHGAGLFYMYAKFKGLISQNDEENNQNIQTKDGKKLESSADIKHREETGEDPDF